MWWNTPNVMMTVKVRPRLSVSDIEDLKSPADWKENKHRSTLRQILRPCFICLAISGCYTYDADFIKNGKETTRGRPYRIFGIIYRIFCFLMCFAACIKSVAAFFTLSTPFAQFNVVLVSWYIECTIVFLITCKSVHHKFGYQRKTFDFWDETIRPGLEEIGIDFPTDKIKTRQTIYLVIGIFICVLNISGIILISTDILSNGYGFLFAAPFSKSPITSCIALSMMSVATFAWVLPIVYVILISTLLTATFQAFNDFLEKQIKQNGLKPTYSFYKIRLLHLNLSTVVSELDNDFKYMFAVMFIFNIGNACFILYQIIKMPLNTIHLIMNMFWMVSCSGTLGAVAVFAALVNETVSRSGFVISARLLLRWMYTITVQGSQNCFYLWKGLYSKSQEFAPLVSKFFP